jgi:hypothetical protein
VSANRSIRNAGAHLEKKTSPEKKQSCRSFAATALIFKVDLSVSSNQTLNSLLANVGNSRNVSAELERSSLFTTASAESDSNDSGSENDSALHGSISCYVPK